MTDKDTIDIASIIKRARTAANLTQQETCDIAGLSYSTLAKIERGVIKEPSVFTISKLADAFGTDMNTLIGKNAIGGLRSKYSLATLEELKAGGSDIRSNPVIDCPMKLEYWMVVDNLASYDNLFQTHHMLVPKRDAAEMLHLGDDELGEMMDVLSSDWFEENYHVWLVNGHGRRSVLSQFHIHLGKYLE